MCDFENITIIMYTFFK